MTILSILFLIAIVGFVCYVLISFVAMPEPFPKLLIGAAVLLTLFYILKTSGVHLP